MWHLTKATATGKRDCNEDRHAVSQQGDHEAGRLTAVVCDGLGGHEDGEMAAEAASNAFSETASMLSGMAGPEASKSRLRQAVECANGAIRDRCGAKIRQHSMATTLTGIEIENNELRWVSVGDSPLMLHRTGWSTMQLLNKLHNPPGQRHSLISVINGDPIAHVDRGNDGVALRRGDTVIVASDGIDSLEREAVAQVLQNAQQPEAKLAELLVHAVLKLNQPRQDNVTVVAVRIS